MAVRLHQALALQVRTLVLTAGTLVPTAVRTLVLTAVRTLVPTAGRTHVRAAADTVLHLRAAMAAAQVDLSRVAAADSAAVALAAVRLTAHPRVAVAVDADSFGIV